MYPSVIWGSTCDSDDCPIPQCILPELERGDWLLVENMGAYNSIKASNFNGFPKAGSHFVMSQQAWWVSQYLDHTMDPLYTPMLLKNVIDHTNGVSFFHQVSDAEDVCWDQT